MSERVSSNSVSERVGEWVSERKSERESESVSKSVSERVSVRTKMYPSERASKEAWRENDQVRSNSSLADLPAVDTEPRTETTAEAIAPHQPLFGVQPPRKRKKMTLSNKIMTDNVFCIYVEKNACAILCHRLTLHHHGAPLSHLAASNSDSPQHGSVSHSRGTGT